LYFAISSFITNVYRISFYFLSAAIYTCLILHLYVLLLFIPLLVPLLIISPCYCCSSRCWFVLSGGATNTNFIVFCLTWSGLKSTIYHTRGEHTNHYTTDAVYTVLCTLARQKDCKMGLAFFYLQDSHFHCTDMSVGWANINRMTASTHLW
jgi:hypothetical protein